MGPFVCKQSQCSCLALPCICSSQSACLLIKVHLQLLSSKELFTLSVCVWLSICLSGDLWCQQLEHGCSLGAHVSRCHQLGRLSKPRCWIDPLCGDIYICISIPISGPVSYPAREGSRTRPLVLPVFYECSECPSVTCTASCLYMYI